MLGGISHSSLEPEVFLQGALKEAPERVVSVSTVASVVTFKKVVLLFEPSLICYERKPREFFVFFFLLLLFVPFLFPVLSCLEYGCLMPLSLSEVA